MTFEERATVAASAVQELEKIANRMASLEQSIENKFVVEARKVYGIDAIKFGRDGWPDRLVPLGRDYPGAMIWIEFKTVDGRLRPNQKVRHKQLAAMGQTVFVCRSHQEGLGAIAKARRSIDRTK